jgi:hypothetical protein
LPLGLDAEILFVDRAAVPDPEFAADPATVAEICARLDGLPMAIELAAARIPALGVGGVLAGLDDSLRLVAGGHGADARHHSLRAVIGWSYDLLDDEERRFFRHLAVFAGTFSLKAALAVISAGDRANVADLLGRLVDKSLVVHQRGAPGRWRLLDTVRAFAADRLRANGEEAQARGRHRAWFAAYAAELEQRIGGQWRDEFDAVACDLRAALAGCPPGPDPVAHGLARALGHLTFARRFLQESLGHYEQAAAHAPSPLNAAQDLTDAAECALLTNSSGDRAFELLLAAADQACRAGDGDAQAIALARAVEIAARHTGSYPALMPGERLKDVLQHAASAGDPAHPPVAAALAAAKVWSASPVNLKLDPVNITLSPAGWRRRLPVPALSGAIHTEVFCLARRLAMRRPVPIPPAKTTSSQSQTGAWKSNHRKWKWPLLLFWKMNTSATTTMTAAMICLLVGRHRCFAGGFDSFTTFLPQIGRSGRTVRAAEPYHHQGTARILAPVRRGELAGGGSAGRPRRWPGRLGAGR